MHSVLFKHSSRTQSSSASGIFPLSFPGVVPGQVGAHVSDGKQIPVSGPRSLQGSLREVHPPRERDATRQVHRIHGHTMVSTLNRNN